MIYTFRCIENNHVFEKDVRLKDYRRKYPCPKCGGKTIKTVTPVSISFKGSGFYKTDNKKEAPK